MSAAEAMLGQQVVMVSGADGDRVMGFGIAIAYCDAPTFVIEHQDGTRTSWRSDLTRPSQPPRQVYRARRARHPLGTYAPRHCACTECSNLPIGEALPR